MWKILERSIPFYIKFDQQNGIEILITDFIHIWSKSFTETSFLCCLMDSNSNLKFTNEVKLIERGKNLLSDPEKLESELIREDNNTISISLSTYVSDFRFKLECKLQKQSEEYFFQHVTKLLLKTIRDLRASETELRNLLVNKDKEISKYSVQNVDIVYSGKTDVFNNKAHSSKYNMYEKTFGQGEISDIVLNKVFEPSTISLNIKKENDLKEITIKTEKESNDIDLTTVKEEHAQIKTEPGFCIPKRKKNRLNY